ncbi:MAG: hypothetical protein KAS65_09150 [Candidatus Aminicenantes bacterium]|nr:hypothetical protein [Candidatus Aminicenantes bacterium]
MGFEMETFIDDIFAPTEGEVLTVMIDIPHGKITDNQEWKARRRMAEEWLNKIKMIASKWKLNVNPLVTYRASGGNNADIPDTGCMLKKEISLKDIIEASTMIISMPEYSATAPLYEYSRRLKKLRVASMPGTAKFMEETGLAADYIKIHKRCQYLVPIFKRASGAEVRFSSGHFCYFDLSTNEAYGEDGILHPERGGTEYSCSNLPAGEVYIVPNESQESHTHGELPFRPGNEVGVFTVASNRIVEVKGHGLEIESFRQRILGDKAWQNIAEFAIGINDRATITGNVLQDEKAGFHWAWGRSDHLGGTIGIKNFNSPENVVHHDIVYARGNPIVCTSLDMVFPDGSKKQLIKDELLIE